jgi:hypothetical protein
MLGPQDLNGIKCMRLMLVVVSLMVGSIISLAYFSSANAQMGRGAPLQAHV